MKSTGSSPVSLLAVCGIVAFPPNYAWAFSPCKRTKHSSVTPERRVTSGLATENIQALYCLCANPVPGSSSDQRRTHLCPLLCDMWHFFSPTRTSFSFVTDKTFRKCTTPLCDPNMAAGIAAKRQRWARSCCLCSLSHSWGFVFGFWCNIIVFVSRSKPLNSSTVFFYHYFSFLEPHAVPSKVHLHIQVDEVMTALIGATAEGQVVLIQTYTHSHTRTQLVHDIHAPKSMKDRVGGFLYILPYHHVSDIMGAQAHITR